MIKLTRDKTYLAPSILSADFCHLEKEIRSIEEGGADILHLDVMDGHFVPNLTFGPPIIKNIREITRLPLDVHLMIHNAESSYQQYIDAGADMISVHVEAVNHLHRLITAIKSEGIMAGVVLNPASPLCHLDEILPELDYILLMSVNPGFGGQSFIQSTIDKIKNLRSRLQERKLNHILIELDGGVNINNIKSLSDFGVDILVAGSAVFHSKDSKETTKKMKERMNSEEMDTFHEK